MRAMRLTRRMSACPAEELASSLILRRGLAMAAFGFTGLHGFAHLSHGDAPSLAARFCLRPAMLMLGLRHSWRLRRPAWRAPSALPESKPRPAPPAPVPAAVEAPVAAPQAEALRLSSPLQPDDKSSWQLDLEAQAEAEKNSVEPPAPPPRSTLSRHRQAGHAAAADPRSSACAARRRAGSRRLARPVAPPRSRRAHAAPALSPRPRPRRPPRRALRPPTASPARAVPPAKATAPTPRLAGDKSFGWLERALRATPRRRAAGVRASRPHA